MQIPKGATVAVADGEKCNLFQNVSDNSEPKLKALPDADVDTQSNNANSGRKSSAAVILSSDCFK